MELAIGNLTQIPPGEGRTFALGVHRVAVFHSHAGAVFATQADCPHKSGPLADGLTDERSVVCPLHDRAFDFLTGAGLGNECAIKIYPVRATSDGTIMITLDATTIDQEGA